MKSHNTSYVGLFDRHDADLPVIERIEIPIIQRDYAQGRNDQTIARIRADFLDALHAALVAGPFLSLDFVYGDVAGGAFRPLDGQQRLTTLFLLHWYLAWRAHRPELGASWRNFAYATRPSARGFCERLATASPTPATRLRPWFEDQPWFLSTWEHDPTIQSMLTMIDSIHERFAPTDCVVAWERLTDQARPAITFHLLPIEKLGLSADLYLKMNSRGKPLTPFENFKARFEQLLESTCPARVDEFAQKVDGSWADVMWPLRGNDDIADHEFLSYLRFVTELCAWEDGRQPAGEIDALAEQVYGQGNAAAGAHLDFLINCFDTWVDTDIDKVFAAQFALQTARLPTTDASKVVLFGPRWSTVNLFKMGCKAGARQYWPHTLLLYAVLLHRLRGTANFSRRLRHLRNLIEASSNELRADRLPALLADVRRLVVEGALDKIPSLNQSQVSEEQLKEEMLVNARSLESCLFLLEDHPLLRGSLGAFELDSSVFEARANAFHRLFASDRLLPMLTGALLAFGDYSRGPPQRFQLGSSSEHSLWSDFLTGASRGQLARLRIALAYVLDAIAASDSDLQAVLTSLSNNWLANFDNSSGMDWRWYLVRYPEMRDGRSGNYALSDAAGYGMCMLDKKTTGSYYRDAYLFAIRQQAGVSDSSVYGDVWQNEPAGPWFTGYETQPRWMQLAVSGAAVRCVENGFELRPPPNQAYAERFERVCEVEGIKHDLRMQVPQILVQQRWLDTTDRVQAGARLLRALCEAGL